MKPEIEYIYNKLKKLRFDFNSIDFKDFRSEYRYEPTLKRYVRKDDNDLFIDKNTFKPLEEELEYADIMHNLEEQLGCPLDTVLKALKYGIYQEDGGRRKLPFIEYNSGTNKFYFGFGTYCNVEDYKKTWWLKEDKSE